MTKQKQGDAIIIAQEFINLANATATHYEMTCLDSLQEEEIKIVSYLYQLGYLVEPNPSNGYAGKLPKHDS